MDKNLNELIRSANLLYGTLKLDSKRYSNALEYYKSALHQLFELRNQNTGAVKGQIEAIIENLLKKAEDCQNKRDNFTEEEVKKINNSQDKSAVNKFARPLSTMVSKVIHSRASSSQTNPYETMIEQEIIERSPQVSWDSISGLRTAKEILQEAIIRPTLYPHIYTGLRSPPKGILLFGPPGTGKTLLAKAVASECSATFMSVSSATLTSKNYGDGEKLVRALFSVARKYQPSVIFIDEVDSILGSRGEGQHEASRRLETEFLVQMDGVGSSGEDRVLIIAATNRPQELDEAVRRRLTKRIYIPLPDSETRQLLILNLLKENSKLSKKELNHIVKITDGYSGSDLSNLCKEAAMDSVRGLSDSELKSGKQFPIGKKNFENALRVIRPSVQKSSLDFYQRWNDEFGVR